MNKIRLSSLFILSIILIFGLIACGNNDSPKEANADPVNENVEPNDNDAVNNNEEENEDDSENLEEKYEAVDLGGRVIRIANHWDMTPLGGTELRDQIVKRHEYIEEKYNITIEYVEVTFDEKINTLTSSILANDPFADLVSLGSRDRKSVV